MIILWPYMNPIWILYMNRTWILKKNAVWTLYNPTYTLNKTNMNPICEPYTNPINSICEPIWTLHEPYMNPIRTKYEPNKRNIEHNTRNPIISIILSIIIANPITGIRINIIRSMIGIINIIISTTKRNTTHTKMHNRHNNIIIIVSKIRIIYCIIICIIICVIICIIICRLIMIISIILSLKCIIVWSYDSLTI